MKQGWEIKKLGEVCTVIAGQSPEGKFYNSDENGLPFYQGKKEFTEKYIGLPKIWTTKITKEAEENDILMSVRAPVGPINIATQKICIGRGLAAIRASKLIDKEFLFNFLLKHENEIIGNAGAVFNSINKTQIGAIEIPLPSLPKQQQIVALLDKAFTNIAKAKANAEQNLKNAKELFESYLQGVFEKKGEDWEKKSLTELCINKRVITYGVIKLGKEYASGVPCLRTSNVRWLHIDTKGMKRIAPDLSAEYSRTLLNGGEILVNVRGTLGGVAVVTSEMTGWNVSREVAVVPVDPLQADPTFISYLIGSTASQKWLGGVKKGAAYVGINLEDLRLLPVKIPKMGMQLEIVRDLEFVHKKIQQLELIYQKKIKDLEELKKSILQKAFNGEL